MTAPKTKAPQRAKRLPTKAEREVLLHMAREAEDNADYDWFRKNQRAVFRRLARELRARAEGKKRAGR